MRDPMAEMVFGHNPRYLPESAYELDLTSQHTILEELTSGAFPDLARLEIMGTLVWIKSSKVGGAFWYPSVLDRERLKLIIEGPLPGTIRDVDECIASCFMPGEISAIALARRRPS